MTTVGEITLQILPLMFYLFTYISMLDFDMRIKKKKDFIYIYIYIITNTKNDIIACVSYTS